MDICSFERAREIMGDNFFGFKEVREQYWVYLLDCGFMHPSIDDLLKEELPFSFSEELLETIKDTHLLVLDLGFSIQHLLCGVECDGAFYKTTSPIQWKIFSKGLVPGSTSKTCSEQATMLNDDEVISSVREVAYLLPLYQMVRDESLLEQKVARTLPNGFLGRELVVSLHSFSEALGTPLYSMGGQPMSLNITPVAAKFKSNNLGVISRKS